MSVLRPYPAGPGTLVAECGVGRGEPLSEPGHGHELRRRTVAEFCRPPLDHAHELYESRDPLTFRRAQGGPGLELAVERGHGNGDAGGDLLLGERESVDEHRDRGGGNAAAHDGNAPHRIGRGIVAKEALQRAADMGPVRLRRGRFPWWRRDGHRRVLIK